MGAPERAQAVALSAKVLGAMRNFAATAEAVPLGKVASPQAMTEGGALATQQNLMPQALQPGLISGVMG